MSAISLHLPPLTLFTPCFKGVLFFASRFCLRSRRCRRSRAITAIYKGAAGYFCPFVANKPTYPISTLASPNLFHWVTQSFPLGHARFSLGHPRVILFYEDRSC